MLVGRRGQNDPAPFAVTEVSSVKKLVVADVKAQEIPREWFRVWLALGVENMFDRLYRELFDFASTVFFNCSPDIRKAASWGQE